MVVHILSAFALLATAGSTLNDDLPPEKYQGDPKPAVIAVVADPNKSCGEAPAGWRFLACEYEEKGVPIILMPNPCKYLEASDPNSYAHLLCHEFGHVNGWNNTHNN